MNFRTNDTGTSIFEALIKAPPVANSHEAKRPARRFEYSSSSRPSTRIWFDANSPTIVKFRDLESLLVGRISLTPHGITTLKTLPALKNIKAEADAATAVFTLCSFRVFRPT